MPTPTRPSTGGPVESSWGQEVHDQVFTPAAGEYSGNSPAVGALFSWTAVADPGGFLPSPGTSLTVPSDGDGLYLVSLTGKVGSHSVAGGGTVWCKLAGVDGPPYASYYAPAGFGPYLIVTGLIVLTVGQTIAFVHSQGPTGAIVGEAKLRLQRIGRSRGAA